MSISRHLIPVYSCHLNVQTRSDHVGRNFIFIQALGLKGFSALSSISSYVLRGSLNNSLVSLKKENCHHFAAVSFLSVPSCSENVATSKRLWQDPMVD